MPFPFEEEMPMEGMPPPPVDGGDADLDPAMLEGVDSGALEAEILDEIMEYAQAKEAEGLKSKYAPPAPAPEAEGEPIPGVEAPADGETAPAGEGELTAEDLERLLS